MDVMIILPLAGFWRLAWREGAELLRVVRRGSRAGTNETTSAVSASEVPARERQ